MKFTVTPDKNLAPLNFKGFCVKGARVSISCAGERWVGEWAWVDSDAWLWRRGCGSQTRAPFEAETRRILACTRVAEHFEKILVQPLVTRMILQNVRAL